MKRAIISRVLYVLLILFCVGFYIYSVIVKNADPVELLGKLILIMIGCIVGFVRNEVRYGLAKLSVYEESCAKVIGEAFSDDKRTRKKLLRTIRYFDYGNNKKAIKAFRRLKNKCKKSEDYLCIGIFLAKSYSQIHSYYAAINEYEEILSKQIESERLYNYLANEYSRVGKKDMAIQCYEKAISRFPDYEYSYINLASIYFGDKDYDMAINYATKAFDINHRLAVTTDLLAIMYALQGDEERKDKYFRLSIANGSHVQDLNEAIEYYLAEKAEEEESENDE